MGKGASLLLVDDEEGILVVLSALLEDMGYDVATASSGRRGLELFEARRPSIVVTDIKMAGMDGIALLKEIKKQDENVEVLMLTGHGDMELAVESLRSGAGDFLHKPVSDTALEVALERAEERIALREALRRHAEELESLVEQRTRELIASERFAAVGEAAAGLAHSIKNIAGALEGAMFVLEKGLELNKREYFEQGWQMVRSDVSRLRSLAVGLLDLGRPAAFTFAPHDPDEPARQVAELVKSRADEAGVRLELDLQAGSEAFVMDAEAVRHCLLNLALNAIEACAESRSPEREGLARLLSKREKRADGAWRVVYTVADNGPGMPDSFKSEQPRHFHSTKEGGSGMGLFATRKIVNEMGAELRFSDREGGGVEASLCLSGNASLSQ